MVLKGKENHQSNHIYDAFLFAIGSNIWSSQILHIWINLFVANIDQPCGAYQWENNYNKILGIKMKYISLVLHLKS